MSDRPRRIQANSGKLLGLILAMLLIFVLVLVGKIEGHEGGAAILGVAIYIAGNGVNALRGRLLSGVLDPTPEHRAATAEARALAAEAALARIKRDREQT